MTKDVRWEETSKFVGLSGYTYNDEISFVGIECTFIHGIQPDITLR